MSQVYKLTYVLRSEKDEDEVAEFGSELLHDIANTKLLPREKMSFANAEDITDSGIRENVELVDDLENQ